MDPYTPPQGGPAPLFPTDDDGRSGKPCPECGSRNTSEKRSLRKKPSILGFLLFGWLLILFHTAFTRKSMGCLACGHGFHYRSVGNYLSMGILSLITLLILVDLYA